MWMVMCALLGLGLLSTAVDFAGQFSAQPKQALETGQRVIMDARSGKIFRPDVAIAPSAANTSTTPADSAAAPTASFDVGEEETPAETASPPSASAAKVPSPPPAVTPGDTAPTLTPTQDQEAKIAPPTGKNALVMAPAPEVSETTPEGVLPKRGGKAISPAQIYSRYFTAPEDTATIHFIVTGLGFSIDTLALARELPGEVSFSFSPYGTHLAEAINAARGDGHEAWLDMPMQTEGYPQNDPGPLGLIASLGKEEFSARLNKLLMAAPGVVGVILPQDETLSLTPAVFSGMLDVLHTRGLLVLSTHPNRRLQELGVKKDWQDTVLRSDVLLDAVPSEAAIKSRLAGLVAQARERGRLVVVLRARPQSLMLLRDWLKKTSREDVVLAPLSAALLKPPPPPKKPAKDKAAGQGAH